MIQAAIGLVGVLVGAFISWLTASRFERRRNAVTLYTEFATPDMEKCRDVAFKFLLYNLQLPNPLTFQEMHGQADDADLAAVSRLLHFWEKTWYLLQANYVDAKLTREFLRHYFENHYQKCLAEFARLSEMRDEVNYRKWALAVRNLARVWGISHKPRISKSFQRR